MSKDLHKKYLYISEEEYNTFQSRSNFPIIRYADVLLIYAEAANMAAGAPTAKLMTLLTR
jgi:hypothetical protein